MVLISDIASFKSELKRKRESLPPLVLLFPGQGAQFSGMLCKISQDPAVQSLMARADEAVSPFRLSELCLKGTTEELALTENSQPAIYLTSLCALAYYRAQHPFDFPLQRQIVYAGLSLGEYSALAASGRIDFVQGLKLVQARSKAMSEAAKINEGRMVSVVGWKDINELEKLCEDITKGNGVLKVANYLFPGGCAIAGDKFAVEALINKIAELHPEWKCTLLATSGAFHTAHMATASGKLKAALDQTTIAQPSSSNEIVYSNVTAGPHEVIGSLVSDSLIRQMSSPVQWEACMKNILGSLTTSEPEVVELGPGKQLKAMMRRINPEVATNMINVEV